jgi:hypothetical protein
LPVKTYNQTSVGQLSPIWWCVIDSLFISLPKILKIKCGRLLGDYELCVILKSISVNWPVDVPWSSFGYIPYKFEAALSFEVVYNSADLPGQSRILKLGL